MSLGILIMLGVTSMLIVFGLMGIVVEHTQLCSKGEISPTVVGDAPISERDLLEFKTTTGRFLLSFSFSRNFNKIFFSEEYSDKGIRIMLGLKFMAMVWIIYGKSFMGAWSFKALVNKEDIPEMSQAFLFSFVPSSWFSYTIFFFVSGFLASHFLIQKMYPTNGKIRIGVLYFHRFYLLAPAIFLFIAFYYFVVPFFGYGPFWPEYVNNVKDKCTDFWWTDILFI
jgi:hypothetical protein